MEVFKPPEKQFEMSTLKGEDEVFLLDYTGGAKFVLELSKKCSRCTVLDHHESALKALRAGLDEAEPPESLRLVLDMNRSGATIALDYFSSRPAPKDLLRKHGEPSSKKQRSVDHSEWTSDYSRLFRDAEETKKLMHIFRLIEDADIWRWWLEGSKNFSAGFASLCLDMNPNTNPQLFESLRKLRTDAVMKIGAASRKATDDAIAEEMERTFELNITPAKGIRCLGVITKRGELRSEMGHRIALKSKSLGLRGFGCVIYDVEGLPKGKIKLSVRGLDGENSLEITECFGGGGHKGASSCNVDLSALQSWGTPPALPDALKKSQDLQDMELPSVCGKCDTHGVSLVRAFGCPCCEPEVPEPR